MREHAEAVRRYARSLGWYLPGADFDDLEQEALIGLMEAVRAYDPALGSFWPFVRMVVYRRLVELVRCALYEKRRMFEESIRTVRNDEGEVVDIAPLLPDARADVPRIAQARAELQDLLDAAPMLTRLERRALYGFLSGYSYAEIEGCGDARSVKVIDNALQRARLKLRRAA